MVKKLLIFAVGLMTPIWLHAANGDVAGVVVSSGTFYSIETSSVGTNLRQVVVIGDPSTTKKAPVDTVQGLTVNLASSSAAGIGSLSAGTAAIGTVQPGNTQNTTPWQVISTNTVLGTGANTIGSIGNTGFNVNNTPAVTQSGTWTVQPGNTQNSTPWQVISTNTVLGAGTAEIGNVKNSGTFATQDSQAGTWTVQPGNTQNTVPWQFISTNVVVGAGTASIGTVQPGNTQNTVPWQVISTNVVIGAGTAEIGNVKNGGTFAVQAAQSGTWTFTPVALTTVTFNGTAQPVSQSGVWGATVTYNGTQSVNATVVNVTTVTFNGTSQPVNSTSVNTTTVTFNGTAQPVNATPVGTSTVTFNNVFQPVAMSTQIVSTANVAIVIVSTFANVAASQTDQILVSTLTATNRICVHYYSMVTAGTATNVTFNTKPAAAGTAIWYLTANGANGGINSGWVPVPVFCTNAGDSLSVTTGAGSTTGIGILYGKE